MVTTSLSAHRRDALLQAARLDVGQARVAVELDLTPGIALADAVIAEVDVDRDGVLTAEEGQAYARRVANALELSLDGRALQLDAVAATVPDLTALRRGEGTIELRSSIDLPPASASGHRLSFRNTYRGDISVYLANALVPEGDRVVVTAQRRDPEQRSLTIDYRVRANRAVGWPLWAFAAIAVVYVGSAFRRTYMVRLKPDAPYKVRLKTDPTCD